MMTNRPKTTIDLFARGLAVGGVTLALVILAAVFVMLVKRGG
jgi:hypothetical protein